MSNYDENDNTRSDSEPRSTRRSALRLFGSGLAGVFLAACASVPPQPQPQNQSSGAAPGATTGTTSGTSATAVAKPSVVAVVTEAPKPTAGAKAGGILRIGQIGDITALDPHIHAFSTSENTGLCYDKLVAWSAQGQPAPMLAESWEMTPDAKQITFHLRKGVTFHSGRELTSDDVKYNYTRIRDPKAGVGQFALQGQWFNTIDTPDKYTVVMKSDQPRPTMFDLFEYLNIADIEILEGPDAKTKVNGTGPFAFVEWVQGDHISLEKNKNYWQPGKPLLDGIQTTFFRDATIMTTQFEAGALDLIRNPRLADYVRLQAEYQGVIHPVSSYQCDLIGANLTTPALSNKQFRQALNYAIDRQRFVDTLLYGLGKPVNLPWSESSPMYDAAQVSRYTFDLDKAKALVAVSGVSNPTIDFSPYPPAPEAVGFAQIYQADLAKIGVTLNIISQETAVWTTAVNSGKLNGMYLAPGTNLHLLPGTLFNLSSPLKPVGNNSNFSDETYTQLVAAAGSETDPAKLKEVYSQLNDILLDQSFVMYLSPIPLAMVAQKSVHDVTPNMHDGAWLETNTWLG